MKKLLITTFLFLSVFSFTETSAQLDIGNIIGNITGIADSSQGFNPDEFLSVGNESRLELDPSSTDESNLVNRILRYLVMIISTFAILMLILGGYFMVTSQGDENRLQKGKNIFFYSVIGILVGFSSYAIVQFVLAVLFGGQ